jgi:hypothetical protein
MLDGAARIDPPDWRFVPDLVRECQARRAEEDRQAETARRQQQQEEARRREEAERNKTPEQRQIEALKRELAQVREQLAARTERTEENARADMYTA